MHTLDQKSTGGHNRSAAQDHDQNSTLQGFTDKSAGAVARLYPLTGTVAEVEESFLHEYYLHLFSIMRDLKQLSETGDEDEMNTLFNKVVYGNQDEHHADP